MCSMRNGWVPSEFCRCRGKRTSLDSSVPGKRARMDFFYLTMISAVESGIGRRQPVRLFLKSV